MHNKNILKGKKARYWVVGLTVVLVAAFVFLRFNSARASNGTAESTATVTTLNVAQTIEASGALAALRQAGMVTSFALALAVAASSLPRDVMMQLFVGNNVTLGSAPMNAFVIGMHSAFLVSTVLVLIAAGISFVPLLIEAPGHDREEGKIRDAGG